MHLASAFATLVASGVLAIAPRASAHGAFPAARQLAVDPNDSNRIFARATCGPLGCPEASSVGTTCSPADWDDVCVDTGKCHDAAPPGDRAGCGCRSASGTGGSWLGIALVVAALGRHRPRLR